jgi:hypothetical protein
MDTKSKKRLCKNKSLPSISHMNLCKFFLNNKKTNVYTCTQNSPASWTTLSPSVSQWTITAGQGMANLQEAWTVYVINTQRLCQKYLQKLSTIGEREAAVTCTNERC